MDMLRETLHNVQSKWANVWLITHVFLEKIKGLQYTLKAITDCEKVLQHYETHVNENSEPTTDLDKLRFRNELYMVGFLIV